MRFSKNSILMGYLWIIAVSLSSMSPVAFAIQSILASAETKVYQSLPVAAEELSVLEKDLLFLPREQQLHWFMLKTKVIVQQSDYKGLEQLAVKAKEVLNGDFPQSNYWNKLFKLNRLIIRKNGQALLRELSKLEQGIYASANERLAAYYHRLLYQAYDIQEIWDFSLDNAVVNQREWEALSEPFFALEAKIAIVGLSANLHDFNGAYVNLREAQMAASQLNLSNVLVELEVLEAKVALLQKKPKRAVEILKALMSDKLIDHNHDLYVLVNHKLALVLLRLENFDEVIELVDELFESGKVKDPAIRVSLDLVLAKSLLEKKRFTEAQMIARRAEKIFEARNNEFGLFQIDQIMIEVHMHRQNLEGVYKRSLNMYDRVMNFDDNQGRKRLERSMKIAEISEQRALVNSLEQDNLEKSEELTISEQLIHRKNRSLAILAGLCLLLIGLFIWLSRLLKKVRRLANTDGLTSISNRRHGLKEARKLILKHKHKHLLGIAIFDLDHFKSVNDTYGHDIGDRVIQTAVAVIQESLGKEAVFCRMGGEEFLVVTRGETIKDIFTFFDTIRSKIFNKNIDSLGLDSPISASVGVTYMMPKDLGKTLTDYIIEADMSLYEAKKRGRNQVRSYKNI